jgi:hypothetical protein
MALVHRRTGLAWALLGLGSVALAAPDSAAHDLHLSGSVVVFVMPSAPGDPPLEAFRKAVAKARLQLEGKGVKVVESGPVLVEHGSLLQRHRKIDFRHIPNFVGSVFFRDGHEPQVQRGLETDGEILSRAGKYFGFPDP